MTTALIGMEYTFERAVADVVDNSITAGASDIWIEIRSDTEGSFGKGPYVLVIDNGKGMSQKELVAAMQYAAESPDDTRSLGKFGLGMKTASTSQAEIVGVISRPKKSGSYHGRCWDLGFLTGRQAWTLLKRGIDDFPELVKKKLRGSSGTAVLWENLCRALPDQDSLSDADKDRLMNEYATDVETHLSLVFNRFISGNTTGRQRKVKIWLNGRKVDSHDPLLRGHPKTKVQKSKPFTIRNDSGQQVTFHVTPAIMPNQVEFVDASGDPDRDAHKKAGGPQGWNASQGFYFYRIDRLIQSGGWSNLRKPDEHTKTARAEVDLTREADALFSLSVSKSRVLIPKRAKERMKNLTAKLAVDARRSYDGTPGKKTRKKKSTKKSNSKKAGKESAMMTLETIYASCETKAEKKTVLKVIQRKYPGFMS